jgi:hypothetical protein
MANRMVLNHADLSRMPPHVQAQIASQMASQGSSIPIPRQLRGTRAASSHPDKIPLSRTFYVAWGVIMVSLLTVFVLEWALYPY